VTVLLLAELPAGCHPEQDADAVAAAVVLLLLFGFLGRSMPRTHAHDEPL
jgi:hypothetical protein